MPTHTVTLRSRGQGQYSHTGPQLNMGSRWRIRISVLPMRGPALQLSLTDLIAL